MKMWLVPEANHQLFFLNCYLRSGTNNGVYIHMYFSKYNKKSSLSTINFRMEKGNIFFDQYERKLYHSYRIIINEIFVFFRRHDI